MVTLEQQLSRIDLNLLVSLSVLIKERNVTKAAKVLYLSQPAMSRTLSRLRDLLGDPLFYRESNGLVPTQKALELQAPLDELLRAMQQLVTATSFSPKECEQAFTISLPPLMSQFLSVPLAKRFMAEAPKASLLEFPISRDPCQQLQERIVDFTIHIEKPGNEMEMPAQKIGQTYAMFYVAPDHPLTQKESVTLEDCLSYRFVDLTLDIRSNYGLLNPIDSYLHSKGRMRDIAFRSGQLQTLIQVMQGTNTVLSSSHKVAELENLKDTLVPIYAMDDSELLVDVYLIEHKRTENSRPHQWLKQLILNTLSDVLSTPNA
ncbi:LysR family transcriptional regulator [Vibrio paucivorans]